MYVCRTLLLLTFTFSLIWELSRGFAAMPACYGVNGLFFFIFFFTGFVFKVTFRFHFVHYDSNIHACTFFLRNIGHSSIFIRRLFTMYRLSTSLPNLPAGQE